MMGHTNTGLHAQGLRERSASDEQSHRVRRSGTRSEGCKWPMRPDRDLTRGAMSERVRGRSQRKEKPALPSGAFL